MEPPRAWINFSWLFYSIAEERGLIIPIEWVLRTACKQTRPGRTKDIVYQSISKYILYN